MEPQIRPPAWPRPPDCLPHHLLHLPPEGARVCVAGLVLVRQRPGTAKGVIFVTLEDEFGVANVVIWQKVYQTFRRAVIAGRLLKVTGRIQRQSGVCHVVAERVEDASDLLDESGAAARTGAVRRRAPDPPRKRLAFRSGGARGSTRRREKKNPRGRAAGVFCPDLSSSAYSGRASATKRGFPARRIRSRMLFWPASSAASTRS
jgi:single-strand DNA-binding protein